MADKRATNNTSKTPAKVKLTPKQNNSPRELRTPSKLDQPGIPRTVFSHGSTLQSLFNDWARLRSRGTTVCRSILALTLHECETGEYPEKLAPLVDSLVEAVDGLQNIVDSMGVVEKQLQAVARLQPTDEPVIGSWSAGEIARSVSDICLTYQKECRLKKYVTENIAHCRDEATSEVLASAWELEGYVDSTRELYLLTDLGLQTSVTQHLT